VVFPQDIEGNYWIVVKADGNDGVEEYDSEDNNTAISTISFRINATQFPDLQVDAVQVPPGADAGSKLAVSWTVSNHGQAATSASIWYDKIYLSADAMLGSGDTEMGSFSNVTYLPPGQGYTNTQEVTLPFNIGGNYYIIVKTDGNNHVDEHHNEGNNWQSSVALPIRLVTQPRAVLAGRFIPPFAPTSAWGGQPVTVCWEVTNTGDAPMRCSGWEDAIVISTDETMDHLVDWFMVHQTSHRIALQPGQKDTLSFTGVIPSGRDGTYYLVLQPDVMIRCSEGGVSDARAIILHLPPPPDLEVTVVEARADTACPGAAIRVVWSAVNNGPGPTIAGASWQDWVYLSDDDVLDLQTDRNLGNRKRGGFLDAGGEYRDSLDVTLPLDLLGTHYVFVCADGGNAIGEGGYEGNNCALGAAPVEIILPPPSDLQVIAVSAPAEAGSGDNIQVGWTVANSGSGPTVVGSWTDAVYLSLDDSLETGLDTYLGTVTHSGILDTGQAYTATYSLTIPNGLDSTRYLIVQTDVEDHVYEASQDDNNIGWRPISIHLTPPPDLQVTKLVVPSQGQSGLPLGIQWTVSNQGSGGTRASSWTDSVFISTDAVLDPADAPLAAFIHTGTLAVGSSYLENRNVVLPGGISGTRYIITKTDAKHEVYEHLNEGNNVRTATLEAVRPPKPDLDITAFEILSQNQSGSSVDLRWRVRNAGGGQARAPWTDAVYLSSDQILEPGVDQVVATKPRTGNLDPNGSYSVDATARFPNGTEGSYYLILRTDSGNGIDEDSESNNTESVPITIELRPADLIVAEILGPDSVNTGQPVTVQWTVRNAGTGATDASSWYDGVYLSRDRILDAQDYDLGSVRHDGSLGSGGDYSASCTGQIPSGLSGTYYFFVRTDKNDNVYEHGGEANNSLIDSAGSEVVIPAPADLVVGQVVADSVAVPGEYVEIRWSIENRGVNTATGTWTDAVYASQDTLWDNQDPMLGTVTYTADLLPGELLVKRLAVTRETFGRLLKTKMLGVLPGEYRMIVRTDVLNNIVERSENNNEGRSQAVTVVNWLDLPLGEAVSVPIAERDRKYYHLSNPSKQDTRWSFRAEDATASARVFIREDALPSPVDFDASATLSGGDELFVVVASNTAEDVFVLVCADRVLPEHTVLHILTTALQAGLFDIVPDRIGNTGPVSLTLDGSGFSDGDRLFLRSGVMTIEADSLVALSSTSAQSTIHMHGEPAGAYDVVVNTVSGDSLVLENAINVEEGSSVQLVAELEGQTVFRQGVSSFCEIRYSNPGNTDVQFGVINCDPGENLKLRTSLPYPWPSDENEPSYGDVVSFLIYNVPPGGGGRIPLWLDARSSGSHSIEVESYVYTLGSNPGPAPAGEEGKVAGGSYAPLDGGGCQSNIAHDGRPPCGSIIFQRNGWCDHVGVVFVDAHGDTFVTENLATPPGNVNTPIRDFLRPPRGVSPGYYAPRGGLSDEECKALTKWAVDNKGKYGYFGTFKCTEYARLIYGEVLKRKDEFIPDDSKFSCLTSPGGIYAAHNCGKLWDGSNWVEKAFKNSGWGPAGQLACAEIFRIEIPFRIWRWVNSVNAHDPNEKAGPTRDGESPFVRRDQMLPYSVYFENSPEAAAPAQRVLITDRLDDDLDLRAFKLTEIAFGDTVITVPQRRSYWQQAMTLRSGDLLEIDAGIDLSDGEAHWIFNTTDPATGLPPLDPMAGFLPPNDSTHCGEGHVSFTIMADPDAPAGTEIANKATIVFDTNDAIETNEVRNVIRDAFADLVVSSARVEEGVVEGEETQILCTAGNFGEVDVSPVTLKFYGGAPGDSTLIGAASIVTGLRTGQEREISTTWTPRRVLGDRTVSIVIDPDTLIRESDEENNARVLTLPVGPRTYEVPLDQDVNLVALPLESAEPYTARSFAQLLGADLVIRCDTTGSFEAFIPDTQSSDGFQIEPTTGYIAVIEHPSTVTFSGMTHLNSVKLRKGTNFVSLPLQPDSTLTARSLCEKLGANTLIRYNGATRQFEAFIPDFHTGEGFDILGARGYIAFADSDTTVSFDGKGWVGSEGSPPGMLLAASPSAQSAQGTSILGLTGVIYCDTGENLTPLPCQLPATVKNKRTGAKVSVKIDPRYGEFSGAFVDLSNSRPVQAGDVLEMVVMDSTMTPIGEPVQYTVTVQDIGRRYAVFDAVVPMVGAWVPGLVPRETCLSQNNPNPFMSSTRIRFDLAAPGKVSLKIYSVQGQLVKTLVDETLKPGRYSFDWRGVNDEERRVAPGQYFCRMVAPGYEKSKKIVLLE
jgi:subtilase family serine protease